jgi:hypothetical protein
MGFPLLRDGWSAVAWDRAAAGAFVLELDLAGERHFYSTKPMGMCEFSGGPWIICTSAVLNQPTYSMSVDPYSRQFSINNVQFVLMAARFPIAQLVRSGLDFSKIPAKVRWIIDGRDLDLDQALLLIDGFVSGLQYSEASDQVSFAVVDNQLTGDRLFPPRSVNTATFSAAAIPAESFGKCYPVVVGAASKMPVIDISTDKTRYLVMDDPVGQFSGGLVSAVYDGDATKAENAEAEGTDLRGDGYWYVDITGDAAESMDVTVDVDNGIPGEMVDAIFYLLNCYSNKRDMFDMTSLWRVRNEFNSVTFSIVFNSVVQGGVIQAIRERLLKEFPLLIIQQGAKLCFQGLFWDRQASKVLSTDSNILSVVSEPSEIDRSQLANEFDIRGGISGLRGDSLCAISRNKDNDATCLTSYGRYGELGMRSVDVPDVADADGLWWLMEWMVQTYALKRVRVSYLCTLDAVSVRLWDTVRVYDHYQGWTHGPLFKVVGIQYGESNGIALDLLSVDDSFDVYAVNRKPYASLELLGAEVV